MKLSVTQENLSKALGTVSRVASPSSTLPILANVLIKTVNNQLQIVATNLDIAISQIIGSKVDEEGSITVPARIMNDFISSLPSGNIDLKLEKNKLHIEANKNSSTINGVDAEDFPVMPTITKGKTWVVDRQILANALGQVVIAAGNDDSRPVLTGVLCKGTKDALYIAATDSYRLAEKTLEPLESEIDLLIPAPSLKDLQRILDGAESDQVKVTYDDQQVMFEVDSINLVTRLIDGKYPDYQKLVPKTFGVSATLPKADLMNIAKVSSLFARESAGSIKLEVNESESKISIRSVASQLGENTSDADAKVEGSGDITLNSRYLIEALGVVEGNNVTLSFNGKLDPIALTDNENPDYLHIIMPLKS